jgi:hypothetical protein
VNRRRFLLTSLAGAFAGTLGAEAQQPGKVHRIGVLLPLGVTPPILERLLAGLHDRGWVENQGFVAEARYAEGKVERLPEHARGASSPQGRRAHHDGYTRHNGGQARHSHHSDRVRSGRRCCGGWRRA